MFNEHFRAGVVSKFHVIQTRQVRGLQRRLLDTPEDFLYHIRQYFVSLLTRDDVTNSNLIHQHRIIRNSCSHIRDSSQRVQRPIHRISRRGDEET